VFLLGFVLTLPLPLSGSVRVTDGRYVLKGVSDTELRSFLSFGPAYFEYIHRSYFFKVRPLALCPYTCSY
jgi:hypothetical protein